MIKNTKANLTLIFCINKKNSQLFQALEAITRQTDKNVELIFVFNGSSNSEKEIFSHFDFKPFSNVRKIFASENMGDTYACKYCTNNYVNTKYFYYFDANIILHPDFVASVNNFLTENPDTDVLSFFGVPNIYFKQPFIKIKSLADDFCNRPLVNFDNKVLSIEYIQKNNICEPLFKTWPAYYYVLLLKGDPKWYSIGRRLCDATNKQTFEYNVMDLYDQCEALVDLLNEKPFANHESEIEYICMVTLFRNFLYAFFNKNKGKIVSQKKALNKVEQFMNRNFPKWQSNEFLNFKKNKNDKTYIEFLKEFKPKISYITKAINDKNFLKGYGIKK